MSGDGSAFPETARLALLLWGAHPRQTAVLIPRLGTHLPPHQGQEEQAGDQPRVLSLVSPLENDAFYVRSLWGFHPSLRAELGFSWQRVPKPPFSSQGRGQQRTLQQCLGTSPPRGPSPPGLALPRWWVTHFPPMAPSPAQPQGFLSRCGQLAHPTQHTSHRGALMFDLRRSGRARNYPLRGRAGMVQLSSTEHLAAQHPPPR